MRMISIRGRWQMAWDLGCFGQLEIRPSAEASHDGVQTISSRSLENKRCRVKCQDVLPQTRKLEAKALVAFFQGPHGPDGNFESRPPCYCLPTVIGLGWLLLLGSKVWRYPGG
ncbi:hypothetical protein VTL71DRAFT_10473 [Oculimacula yallundae]|uniref:Uncharacterized protein n=1 Tax=Oculimacula yallundae TaxID=86028 RepID=A0ABR4CT38_9HELO